MTPRELLQTWWFPWVIRILGTLVLYLVYRLVLRFVLPRLQEGLRASQGVHVATMAERFGRYLIFLAFFLAVLVLFGVNIGTMVAALGLFSVAIGFAAQTSVSNLISGLFLLFDRPFEVGDFVRVGDTLGTVLYIDLLSTKMRTPDNLFVRIPNEQVLKSVTVNYTRYPIRRLSIPVGVAYEADPGKVRDLLLAWLQEQPHVLADPPPDVWITGFGDSAVELTVQVWVRREEYIQARNTLMTGIKQVLERHGVDIPFPQRVVHLRRMDDA